MLSSTTRITRITRTTRRTARLSALAVTCAATVALSACSGQQVSTSSAGPASTAPSSGAPTSDAPTSSSVTTEPSSAAPTSDAATSDPAGSGAPVKKGLTFVVKDDVLENTIAFTSVVRGFPVPDKFESLRNDGELVLVEIDATAGRSSAVGCRAARRC